MKREERKKQQLALAIGSKLRYKLVNADTIPQDYVSYRRKCLEIESRLEEANALDALSKVRHSTPKSNNHVLSATPKNTPHLPDRNSPRTIPTGSTPATGANSTPLAPRTTTQGGDAMDLTRARGPLTEDKRQYRRNSNLCLYCGQPGHIASNCPRKANRLNEIELESENHLPSGNA